MRKIVLAGAGTAGHVEPALAVAKWLHEHRSDVELVFLGTEGGVETRLVPAAGFPLQLINKVPFPRSINTQLISWPVRFNKTLGQVRSVMRGADLVIGFGGYVAAPAYISAKLLGVPMIAHEANAKKGMANKLAKALGAKSLCAFGEPSPSRVGIPLRISIVELAQLSRSERALARQQALRSMNLDPKRPTILIFGGSLGSAKFNAEVAEAKKAIIELGFQIIHSVGGNNELPQVEDGYLPLHYIDDMASAYAAADLVICRSGAVSVTEVGVLGIFSLFIPLPIGNGEQIENAREVVAKGGGEILNNSDFSAQWLTNEISRLMSAAGRWRDSGGQIDFPLNAAEKIGVQSLKELIHE
jgi:UDP-N-acetylglucosamine--N-acetylmuramyl-(pentapeptide) pyrophosphoryl-undecaprenol N-acetylglucosamine transferase